MNYFIYASYVALLFCLTTCFLHFLRLIRLGAPKDLSDKSGNISAGVLYSNTSAMLPNQKESAYKHLPTFTAGVIFHIGTFLAFFSFLFLILDVIIPYKASFFLLQYNIISLFIALCLWIGTFIGIGLLIKRLTYKQLRPFSNFDDYFSVSLNTLFQLVSAILFTIYAFSDYFSRYFNLKIFDFTFYAYYLVSAILFLYVPFSKMKHFIYYFSARYHLGFFYGRRGTWPPKKK